MLKLNRFAGSFFDEKFYRVLVCKKVASLDRVIGVGVKAVVFAGNRGHSSLGGDGVAAHRVDFRDDGDV